MPPVWQFGNPSGWFTHAGREIDVNKQLMFYSPITPRLNSSPLLAPVVNVSLLVMVGFLLQECLASKFES